MNRPLLEPVPRQTSRSSATRWPIVAAVGLVLSSTSVLSAAAATTSSTTRPSISIALTDTKVAVPKTIPGGIVDVTMDARRSKTRAHHLAFFRRNDGVTMKQVLAAPDADFDKYVTYQGGNSSVHAGKSSRVTLDLQPGNYMIADFADGPPLFVETVVTAAATPANAPATKGTVTMGPGMAFSIPKGFDASGTWRFTNTDTMPHEAVLVRAHKGTTVVDLVNWAKTPDKPMPADILGGIGALGQGKQGWVDLGSRPKAGKYYFVCMIPGPDGVAHLARGMATGFTIS